MLKKLLIFTTVYNYYILGYYILKSKFYISPPYTLIQLYNSPLGLDCTLLQPYPTTASCTLLQITIHFYSCTLLQLYPSTASCTLLSSCTLLQLFTSTAVHLYCCTLLQMYTSSALHYYS